MPEQQHQQGQGQSQQQGLSQDKPIQLPPNTSKIYVSVNGRTIEVKVPKE